MFSCIVSQTNFTPLIVGGIATTMALNMLEQVPCGAVRIADFCFLIHRERPPAVTGDHA